MNMIPCTVEFTNEEIIYLRTLRPKSMLLADFIRQTVLKDMPPPEVTIIRCERCGCEESPQFSSCFCWCHQLSVAPPPEIS